MERSLESHWGSLRDRRHFLLPLPQAASALECSCVHHYPGLCDCASSFIPLEAATASWLHTECVLHRQRTGHRRGKNIWRSSTWYASGFSSILDASLGVVRTNRNVLWILLWRSDWGHLRCWIWHEVRLPVHLWWILPAHCHHPCYNVSHYLHFSHSLLNVSTQCVFSFSGCLNPTRRTTSLPAVNSTSITSAKYFVAGITAWRPLRLLLSSTRVSLKNSKWVSFYYNIPPSLTPFSKEFCVSSGISEHLQGGWWSDMLPMVRHPVPPPLYQSRCPGLAGWLRILSLVHICHTVLECEWSSHFSQPFVLNYST